MRIGSHQLDNNLIVAPMAGVTDRPFRNLCRRLGAGLAVSEMVTADASLYGTRKTVRRLDHDGEPGPVSVQIVGTDPKKMAEAARINVAHGAQIIDINMGCPAKKVCKVAAGSALMRDEPLVERILNDVVDAVDVPVTLKMRTGWDIDNRNAPRIAEMAQHAGVQAVAVHGRTRACAYRGEAEYDTIRHVKQRVSIPVIANGDIDSPLKAMQVLARTGADAVMVGRAAQGRPWIFREITHFLNTGDPLPEPGPEWIRDLLLEHLDALYALYGVTHGVRVARKHIAWYCKTQPGANTFRQRINAAESPQEQARLIKEYFNRLNDKKAPGLRSSARDGGYKNMSLESSHYPSRQSGSLAVAGPERSESLRAVVRDALGHYFDQLDGTPPADLYQMVMQQVEQPLFETVMQHTGGNQSRAAALLGISRSTLRKKLAQYEIE